MLDTVHSLILERVASKGDGEPSPALENLLAAGLVERTPEGLAVTPAGRAALEAGTPGRTELWALRVLTACLAMYAVVTVLDWIL